MDMPTPAKMGPPPLPATEAAVVSQHVADAQGEHRDGQALENAVALAWDDAHADAVAGEAAGVFHQYEENDEADEQEEADAHRGEGAHDAAGRLPGRRLGRPRGGDVAGGVPDAGDAEAPDQHAPDDPD